MEPHREAAYREFADQHMVQLDGLRAIAILMVLYAHASTTAVLPAWIQMGPWGVKLFFVISGFLITGILLRCRGENPFQQVGRFYARRFLRILPAYYVTVLLTLLLFAKFRDVVAWHVLYLSNFLFAAQGEFGIGGHFWSLAVEEQFYLLWPWLVLFTLKRRLNGIAIAMIAAAPCWRGVCVLLHMKLGWILMPGCFDSLGFGALLALACHDKESLPLRRFMAKWALPIGIAVILLGAWRHRTSLVFGDMGVALCSVWLVERAARGAAGRFFALAPISYIGKVSYGIYLLHGLAIALAGYVLKRTGMPDWLLFPLSVSTAIGMAAISWHVYEKPLNELKKYFPYGRALVPVSEPADDVAVVGDARAVAVQ